MNSDLHIRFVRSNGRVVTAMTRLWLNDLNRSVATWRLYNRDLVSDFKSVGDPARSLANVFPVTVLHILVAFCVLGPTRSYLARAGVSTSGKAGAQWQQTSSVVSE